MEALKDPLNQRFCLMSETCIPLYPFNMFRDVLLSLNKSIVNACVWGGMEGSDKDDDDNDDSGSDDVTVIL